MSILRCQKGYTMIETIGVLALIAVIAGSAVAFLNKAFSRYKMARLSQQIVEMQKSIDRRYAARKTYDNLSLQLLVNENLLPKDMRYENNVLYHRLGGKVELVLGDNNESYTIRFMDLPTYACAELLEQNWGLDQRVVLDKMEIGINKATTTSNTQQVNQKVAKQPGLQLPAVQPIGEVVNKKFNVLRWKCGANEQNCYVMPLSPVDAIKLCKDKKNIVSWTFY
ncbi:MAG: hypothetical protein J6Y53_01575 [Alphaproteobacteria bacterium]|nr:hypothetical protein [Alphaproteobacteria bacterium]